MTGHVEPHPFCSPLPTVRPGLSKSLISTGYLPFPGGLFQSSEPVFIHHMFNPQLPSQEVSYWGRWPGTRTSICGKLQLSLRQTLQKGLYMEQTGHCWWYVLQFHGNHVYESESKHQACCIDTRSQWKTRGHLLLAHQSITSGPEASAESRPHSFTPEFLESTQTTAIPLLCLPQSPPELSVGPGEDFDFDLRDSMRTMCSFGVSCTTFRSLDGEPRAYRNYTEHELERSPLIPQTTTGLPVQPAFQRLHMFIRALEPFNTLVFFL
ncbi:uncharacterized protein [Symphalangus syndactylus]|uniref:uncharacterized protein n=1 Tax=Symphalangus syndactylus TaxID=9590 RepID=UPI0030042FB3